MDSKELEDIITRVCNYKQILSRKQARELILAEEKSLLYYDSLGDWPSNNSLDWIKKKSEAYESLQSIRRKLWDLH